MVVPGGGRFLMSEVPLYTLNPYPSEPLPPNQKDAPRSDKTNWACKVAGAELRLTLPSEVLAALDGGGGVLPQPLLEVTVGEKHLLDVTKLDGQTEEVGLIRVVEDRGDDQVLVGGGVVPTCVATPGGALRVTGGAVGGRSWHLCFDEAAPRS